jgi:hypothetical protein
MLRSRQGHSGPTSDRILALDDAGPYGRPSWRNCPCFAAKDWWSFPCPDIEWQHSANRSCTPEIPPGSIFITPMVLFEQKQAGSSTSRTTISRGSSCSMGSTLAYGTPCALPPIDAAQMAALGKWNSALAALPPLQSWHP